ncbi:MAG: NADAR family protein [Deltaproteobacteria bacterium]|nr:NADAR family protein [Deltaproteobacteria bacterium]
MKMALLISTLALSAFGYPAHWWTPVPSEGAPAWESLPQAANAGEVILSKRNELGILSNFAATPFDFRGHHFASLEGLWQSLLFPEGPRDERALFQGLKWSHTRVEVAELTAFSAKAAGEEATANMKKMGINWVTLDGKKMEYWTSKKAEHYQIIREATLAKLSQNQRAREILLSTGDLTLRPDHHQEKDAPPAWRYFEILMELRADLRKTL